MHATDRRGLKVNVHVEGDDALLPPRVTLGLYRVAQEAVTNALRHAGAAHLELRLVVGEGRVSLTVSDDGRGFSPDEPAPGHFGLVGAGERARLLGGELRVESAPGAGTRLVVEVPL